MVSELATYRGLSGEKFGENPLGFGHGLRQVVVHDDSVETFGIGQLFGGFGYSFFDHLGGIGSPAHQPASQLFDRRRHDENGQCLVAETLFEVDAPLDIDIENDHMALVPDPFGFAIQRAVAGAGIDLFPFDELAVFDTASKLLVREKIVLLAVLFGTARSTAGGRNGKFELRKAFEHIADQGRFSRTGGSGKNNHFMSRTGMEGLSDMARRILQNVQQLFFDLFQFVFHFDDQDLHFGVVGFGAQGVDFSAQFLGDKTELAPYPLFAVRHFAEIVAMVLQTDFLFGNVQFFDVKIISCSSRLLSTGIPIDSMLSRMRFLIVSVRAFS